MRSLIWPGDFVDRVICGDALETMTGISDGVIQCCVTSPPYWGLRDYGLKPTVWGGDNGCKHEWGDTRLLTKGGKGQQGGLKGNIHIEETWDTSQTLVQGQFCSLCSAWRGNLGLEPTPELYVQHLVEVFREVRRVLRDDGTLWLNMGDSYASGKGTCFNPGGGSSSLETIEKRKDAGAYVLDRHNVSELKEWGLKPKDLVMIPARVALALQADGWWLRSVIIWHKPSCMPESVTDRPTTAHEYVYLLAKSADYYCDMEAIKENRQGDTHSRGTKRAPPIESAGIGHKDWCKYMTNDDNLTSRNKRTVWTINPEPTPYAHFATFPQKLVEPPIMAGSKAGDIVLDPFSGSGTVGVVAKKLNRKYVLIDLNAEYNKIAEDRLRQKELFEGK